MQRLVSNSVILCYEISILKNMQVGWVDNIRLQMFFSIFMSIAGRHFRQFLFGKALEQIGSLPMTFTL